VCVCVYLLYVYFLHITFVESSIAYVPTDGTVFLFFLTERTLGVIFSVGNNCFKCFEIELKFEIISFVLYNEGVVISAYVQKNPSRVVCIMYGPAAQYTSSTHLLFFFAI
jgi:hypothetical protein